MHTRSILFLTRVLGLWLLAGLLLGSSDWLSALLQPLGGSGLWLQWVPGLCLIWLHHRHIARAITRLCIHLASRSRRSVQARWI